MTAKRGCEDGLPVVIEEGRDGGQRLACEARAGLKDIELRDYAALFFKAADRDR